MAWAATVSGLPREPPRTASCVSCGASPSSGTGRSGTATACCTGALVFFFFEDFDDFEDFDFEVFELFLELFFFEVFADEVAPLSVEDLAESVWAAAPKARHRPAAATLKSLRSCMRPLSEISIDLTDRSGERQRIGGQ